MQSSGIDRRLAFFLLCLVVLGPLFVYSSSYYRAIRKGEDSTYYLLGHIKRLAIASIFFIFGLTLPTRVFKKLILPSLSIIVVLLIITLIAGRPQFGAKRSLAVFSFGVQISEFVRIWIVLFLANFFAYHDQVAKTTRGTLTTVGVTLLLILLVACQPSISIAIICSLTLISMLVYGGTSLKFLCAVLVIVSGLSTSFIFIFTHARARIIGFVSQPAYQVQQSLIAIGSGGILGKGLGAGQQKFLFLPSISKDFIFAHIAEELGLFGTLLVFFLYWQIFLRGITIANWARDKFDRLLVLGLNASIFIIFLVHVGVSLGLLPPTGIPLPFISFGGWSLSANLFAMGIILQVSRQRIL